MQQTEKGERYNQGKPKWSLLDYNTIEGLVKVLDFGMRKYAAHNWKKGLPYSEIVDSLQRHLNSFMNGEELDPESGLPHVDHMQCNTMFLSFMAKNRPDMDDRYKASVNQLELFPDVEL